MTMKEMLKIHREVEREDLEHRIMFRNSKILDKLTDSFPIGAKVTNFGVPAVVDGYHVYRIAYTGSLILRDPETGMRWVAKTEFCKTA